MDKIENISIGPMPESQFLKPLRMTFTQNGHERSRDFVKLHESVSVVIFNTSRNVLILVRQFRPAVFYNSYAFSKNHGANEITKDDVDWNKVSFEKGMTLELCSGIMDDPKLSAMEIAKKEVLEECGYDVPLENFEHIVSYRSGIGVSGDQNSVFYAHVTDEMKTTEGGGLISEGEMIDVIEMTIPEIKEYIQQKNVQSPGGFIFGLQWFLINKVPT